jgi:DNA replication protein DnaC
MRQLSESDLLANIHPNVLAAIREYRETGVLNWTPPPGTPTAPEPPRCPVCHDAGEVAIREPGMLTRYVDCVACTLKVDRLVARVPLDYRHTFDEFQAFAPTRELRDLGGAVRTWAESGEGSLLLVGPEGTLKSSLAAAAYLHRVQHGMVRTAMWVSAPDLLEEIRQGYDLERGVAVASLVVDRARMCDLLVLDDLGAVNVTEKNAPWVQEQFYRVLDHRSGQRLATIMTSNLSVEQLKDQLNRALVSRIVGMCRGRIGFTTSADVRYQQGAE